MNLLTIKDIAQAVNKARTKHPKFSANLAVLMEEVGEAAKAYNDNNAAEYRDELLDCAAVIVRILEGK